MNEIKFTDIDAKDLIRLYKKNSINVISKILLQISSNSQLGINSLNKYNFMSQYNINEDDYYNLMLLIEKFGTKKLIETTS